MGNEFMANEVKNSPQSQENFTGKEISQEEIMNLMGQYDKHYNTTSFTDGYKKQINGIDNGEYGHNLQDIQNQTYNDLENLENEINFQDGNNFEDFEGEENSEDFGEFDFENEREYGENDENFGENFGQIENNFGGNFRNNENLNNGGFETNETEGFNIPDTIRGGTQRDALNQFGLQRGGNEKLPNDVQEIKKELQNLGIKNVKLSNDVNYARQVLSAFQKLKSLGVNEFPKRLEVVHSGDNVQSMGANVTMGGHVGGLYIATSAGKEQGVIFLNEDNKIDVEGVVFHEMGHFLDNDNIGRDRTPINPSIAGQVSQYATTNRDEFVAETFRGLVKGQSYSPEVMNLYRQSGGPKISGMNA